MRPRAQIDWRPNPNFVRLELERRVLILHREILPYAPVVAARLREIESPGRAQGAGNRASGFRIVLDGGPELFARRARRGGMMRFLLAETYFGFEPRPLKELIVAAEAHRRGIGVAEPMGASVEPVGPGFYRGFFLTRAIAGMTLWEFVRADDDPVVREHILLKARAAVATMHNHGLFHADLNLHNLFVTQSGESFAVVILDLDQARLYDAPLSPALRRENAQRLIRSARRLDPSGRYFDAAALRVLDVG
ncbi:MAG TPA: lipopolysaccharide kinase InaA family protein [Candidatus Binataceae bacterium]|nr:lipopolysaccharide kinase InaA family protein [Candidatus Binataceae bacterium]